MLSEQGKLELLARSEGMMVWVGWGVALTPGRAATGSGLEIQYLPLVILEDSPVHSDH